MGIPGTYAQAGAVIEWESGLPGMCTALGLIPYTRKEKKEWGWEGCLELWLM